MFCNLCAIGKSNRFLFNQTQIKMENKQKLEIEIPDCQYVELPNGEVIDIDDYNEQVNP